MFRLKLIKFFLIIALASGGLGSSQAILAAQPSASRLTLQSGAGLDAPPSQVIVQSDGKFLVSGKFNYYGNAARKNILRLHADGSLDTSFDPGISSDDSITDLLVQPDGKILVAGKFTNFNGLPRNRVARLNTDGSLDTSFDPGIGVASTSATYPTPVIFALAIQPDGKILVGGYFTHYSGITRSRIVRLNADGSVDTTFDSSIGVKGTSHVGNGPGPISSASVLGIVVRPNGAILITGGFTTYNGVARHNITSINADGSLDTTFNPGTGTSGLWGGSIDQLQVHPNGKFLINGEFQSYNGITQRGAALLNPDGTPDPNFKPVVSKSSSGRPDGINSIAVQSDGKYVVSGSFLIYDEVSRRYLARLNADGTLDLSYDPGEMFEEIPYNLTTLSGDRLLLTGNFTNLNGIPRQYMAILNSDLSINTDFVPNGVPGGNSATSLSLISSTNPTTVGQSVTFTATLNPVNATGIVKFNFGGVANSSANVAVIDGIATYVTNTLPVGQVPVQASYSGDSNFSFSLSLLYNQTINAACNPLVVTSPTDDGAASSCGTLSYALTQASSGSTISFVLATGNTVSFSGSLIPTVAAGVQIDGGANQIILDGNAQDGTGLQLGGNNQLRNLVIRHFAGRELVVNAGGNWLYQVQLEN